MLKAGSQFYYGSGSTLGDAKGYPGASQFVDSSLLIDAGGTTSATGSSVYAVCASPKFFEFALRQQRGSVSWNMENAEHHAQFQGNDRLEELA
jgi:hypothetical protein